MKDISLTRGEHARQRQADKGKQVATTWVVPIVLSVSLSVTTYFCFHFYIKVIILPVLSAIVK